MKLRLLKRHDNLPVAFKHIAKPPKPTTQTKAWQRAFKPFRTGRLSPADKTNICTKMTRKWLIINIAQHITWYINNWADSSIFKVETFNLWFIGLIGMELRSAQLFIYQYRCKQVWRNTNSTHLYDIDKLK